MDYRFCRELKHNYLIVKNENGDERNSYQMKMFERGRLKSFLPCSIRTINNESYLYYEINSMQSIQDRFSSRGMNREQMMDLFKAMKTAFDSLSEYLLGMENVVLDAKSVFVDLVTGEYKFMYSPFSSEAPDFSAFIDELFLLIDHEDETAVEMVYSCSEKAQSRGVVVMDCIDYVLGVGEEAAGVDEMQKEYVETPDYSDLYSFTPQELEDEENCDKKRKHLAKKIDGKIQLLFSALFMLLLMVMVYLRKNYILSSGENLLSVLVILVSTVTGAIAFMSGVQEIKKGRKGKKDVTAGSGDSEDEARGDFDEMDEFDYGYSDSTVKTSDWSKGENKDSTVNVANYKNEIRVTPSASRGLSQSGSGDCGETTVLDMSDDLNHEMALYSRNTDKTIRISLDKLPITLGKMEGCVDKVLSDNSVSRMHCRLFKGEDDRIMLVDLNSTNGTFKNGLRLNAQEGVSICEGDEVRIGRLCFDCR